MNQFHMLPKQILLLVILCTSASLGAQTPVALKYAERLDSLRMKATLTKLASEEFKGRKAGKKGIVLSQEYLLEQLKGLRLKPANANSYLQDIEASRSSKATKYFRFANFNYNQNYTYKNSAQHDSTLEASKVVFAGYGIYDASHNDFANTDISDKIVLALKGKGPQSKYGVKLHGASEVPSVDYMRQQNAKALILIDPEFNRYSNYVSSSVRYKKTENADTFPEIEIDELLANKLLASENKTVKQLIYEIEGNTNSSSFEFDASLKFNGNIHYESAKLNNLVAIIEGTDLKNEYVMLTAHYDHIGSSYRGKVYNGADDNASGVAAALEIARVLNLMKKSGKGPRRSVVLLLTTAEEDGLKGAEFYTHNPIFPLEKTKACVNIDMLGRMGSKIEEKDVQQGYVLALTGRYQTNATLNELISKINENSTKLSIPKTKGSYYSRSDHYAFHAKKIPSVFFTNGEHDDLHKTTDDVEKIDFPAMQHRAKLVLLTVLELANQE